MPFEKTDLCEPPQMMTKKKVEKSPSAKGVKNAAQKKLSNPISTGGGGVSYEARVQAAYLLAMFTGGPTMLLPEAAVVGLKFQAKIHGYETDDLVCTLLDQAAITRKALLQVKRSAKAITSNLPFREAITAAWLDFNNQTLFTPDSDFFVLVFDGDADSNMRGAIMVADMARTSLSGAEFLKKVTAPGFSSSHIRQAIAAIHTFVIDVVGGPVHLDEQHKFLRHLWFLSHQLSFERTTEYVGLLTQIQVILGRQLVPDPEAVWAQLVDACLSLNKVAASLSFANLDSQINSRIATGFKTHRNSGASHLALREAISASSAAQAGFAVEPDELVFPLGKVVTTLDIPHTDAVLSSSRPDSVNSLISGQLDAINEKLKTSRFQDALEDIRTLGKDLGPFDEHQKARWYLQRGVCHWHLSHDSEAAADFIKASDLYENDDRMAAARVRGLVLQSSTPDAIKAGEAALARFPESLFVWLAYASARLVHGDELTLDDVPVSHREEADVLQILAWTQHRAKNFQAALELSLKSLDMQSAGFYARHTALAIALENATRNSVFIAYQLIDIFAKDALKKAVGSFEPRIERLWSIQSNLIVAETAAYLGHALLILNDPDSALQVIQEAHARGMMSPSMLRVELDALNQAQRTSEMLAKGKLYINQLSEDGLLSLAEVAANVGDVALVEEIQEAVALIKLQRLDMPDVLRAIRWSAMMRSAEHKNDAIKEVLAASLPTMESLPLLSVGARILIGEKEESVVGAAIARARSIGAELETPENNLLLAELFFATRQHEDAAKYYEKVLPPSCHSELHNRLLHCYIETDNRRKAKQLIESFPPGWLEDDDARALAIELGQKAGDWSMLAKLANVQFKNAPLRASSWLIQLIVLARNKSAVELRQFLEGMPTVLEGSIRQIAQLAVQELRYGLEANGMRRIYRLRRTHMENIESASAVMMTILTAAENLPFMEDEMPSVAPGTSFVVVDRNGEQHIVTIDPSEMQDLPENTEFKCAGSIEVERFLDAKIGDEITIEGNFGSTLSYKIETITTGYRRLLDLARDAIQKSLVPVPGVMPISIPTSDDGADFSQIHEQLKRAREHAKQALEKYETLPITLGIFSKLLGRSPIDVVRGWPQDGPTLFMCEGTNEERSAAFSILADLSTAYVTDAVTLTELVSLESTDVLAVLPKLFISSATHDIVQSKLEEARLERSVGNAFDDNGRLVVIEITSEEHAHNIKQLEAIAAAIEKYCEVVPAYGPDVQNSLLLQVKQAISDEEHSVLLLAAEQGANLLTLDGRLRQLAALMSLQGIWPQTLLSHALNQGAISGDKYSLATIRMFLSNRNFVSLTARDLLMMCYQGDVWLKYGIAKYKKYVSSPKLRFDAIFNITLEFLNLVAMSVPQMGAFAELLKHVAEGLLRHKDCPQDVMERIEIFMVDLLKPVGIEYLYRPNAEARDQRLQFELQHIRLFLRDAVILAKEPPKDRPINVKVLMCGTTPLLRNSKDEKLEITTSVKLSANSVVDSDKTSSSAVLLLPE